jgi:hypothetical protein
VLAKIDGLRTRKMLVFCVTRRWSWKTLGLERINMRFVRSMIQPPNPVHRARR